jgi:allantoate deiminase
LEQLDLPLAVVETIAGQGRVEFRFEGEAAHAGTTPGSLRKDALAAAAEWIGAVEADMLQTSGLMATVGRLTVVPGAANVVPGAATTMLDIRHACDTVREGALQRLIEDAQRAAARRGVRVTITAQSDLPATPMDTELTAALEAAVCGAGFRAHRMPSGAGHDSMILAPHVPAAMLFLRSPGGLSHCPEEDVREDDVAAALACGAHFLEVLFQERAHD